MSSDIIIALIVSGGVVLSVVAWQVLEIGKQAVIGEKRQESRRDRSGSSA